MEDAMVTGRMPIGKKAAGNAVLKDAGMNTSQAINRMYSKLIDERSAGFLDLEGSRPEDDRSRWEMAASFVDALAVRLDPKISAMTDTDAKMSRLRSRGLA